METETKRHISDIVDTVVDGAYEIMQFRLLLALGKHEELPENYINYDMDEQNKILELVKPLLATATQTRKVEAETARGVVSLIAKGKIDFNEAIKLMNMVKIKVDIEEKELSVKLKNKMMELVDGN